MPQKPAFPTAPKVNNTALEAKMAAFKTQRTAPNLAAILQQLPSSLLFLAMSPSSPEAIKALKETQPGKDLPDFVKNDLHPVVLKTQKQEDYLAVFTAPGQIPQKENQITLCLPFGQCCQTVMAYEALTGMVLNPFRENIILRRDLLSKAFRRVTSDVPGRPKGQNLVLKNPKPYPQEMVEAARPVLETYPAVKQAYIQHLSTNDRRCYLCLLETDGTENRQELEEKLTTAMEEYAYGLPLEFCPADAMRAELEQNEAAPFYEK